MTASNAQQVEAAINTPIQEDIPVDILSYILHKEPFITVPGVFNIQDISSGPESGIWPGKIFRSGTLENITPEGIQALHSLGIKTVFDLRSSQERNKHPPPDIPGVKIVWHGSTIDDAAAMKEAGRTLERIRIPGEANSDLYESYFLMLKTHQEAFRAIFQHILDRPGKPFLFHCTAGKDRTGILAALIQSLAGTAVSDITRDYGLTRVGIEPVKDMLKQKAAKLLEQFPDHPMIKAAPAFDPRAMTKFLDGMESRHYGVEGWLYTSLGFNELDIVAMKNNLGRNWS